MVVSDADGLDLDPSHYSSKSFRVFLATAGKDLGLLPEEINVTGRWAKGSNVAERHYAMHGPQARPTSGLLSLMSTEFMAGAHSSHPHGTRSGGRPL